MSNQSDTFELEKKYFNLQQEYEELKRHYNVLLKVSKEEIGNFDTFIKFIKQELSKFQEIYNKAEQSRVSAKEKSASHGKAGESHYYYTPTEVADSHIELKRVAIDFCNKLLNHKLIK